MNPLFNYRSLMAVIAWCGISAYDYNRGFADRATSYRAFSSKPKRGRHPRHDRAKAKRKPRHHRHYKRAA